MIQTTTNLANTNSWQNLATVISQGNGFCAYTNFPTTSQLFYREMSVPVIASSNSAAQISLDVNSPLANNVPADNLVAGTYLGLPVLIFDVNAEGDNLHLRTVTVNIAESGAGNVPAAYLYQGSTPIASASVINGTATFAIPDGTLGATIPGYTSVPYTIKVDVTGVVATGSETVAASLGTNQIIFSSADEGVPAYGSAQGNTIGVAGAGAMFNLSGEPSITKVVASQDQNGNATDTYTATFNVTVTAVGESVVFGLPSSGNAAFADDASLVAVYKNGVSDSLSAYNPMVAYSQPVNTTLSPDGTSFTLGINQSVTIPVTYSFQVRNPGTNVYAILIKAIKWSVNGVPVTTSLTNQPAIWMTDSI